jgi:hypothetical protein
MTGVGMDYWDCCFEFLLKVPVWARAFTTFFVPSGCDESAYDGQQTADCRFVEF